MIKLKRKTTADIITTNDGIEHPDLILVLDTILIRNIFNESAEIRFNFYHSEALYDSGVKAIQPEDFGIGQTRITLTQQTDPTFKTMMTLFSFAGDNIGFTDDVLVGNWMLAQVDPIGTDGQLLSEKWEQILPVV